MAKKTARSAPKPDAAAPATPSPAKPRARATSATPRARKSSARDKSVAAPVDTETIVIADETTVVVVAQEPTDEEIRVRAYHRYLERGGSHGSEFDDWLEARRDLLKSR